MVTGATEEFRQHPHMMTATQEEIRYCSHTTSSGKQKKARSTSQPQFRSENNPATIEADQILLALQQIGDLVSAISFSVVVCSLKVKSSWNVSSSLRSRFGFRDDEFCTVGRYFKAFLNSPAETVEKSLL